MFSSVDSDSDDDLFSPYLRADDLSDFDALHFISCQRSNEAWAAEVAEREALWSDQPWSSPVSVLSDLPNVPDMEGLDGVAQSARRKEGVVEQDERKVGQKRKRASSSSKAEGSDGEKRAKKEKGTRGPKTEARKDKEREKRKEQKKALREKRKAAGLPARQRSEASRQRSREKKAWKSTLR